MRKKLYEYFYAHEAELKAHLSELIAFKSLEENPNEIASALDHVVALAASMGMRTGYTSGRRAAYAEIGEGEETVGILAHVDVVGIGDINKWTSDPFELNEREGVLFGRGIVDDKGPVIMSLYALKAILDMEIPLKKRIRLIVGTSEESIWSDMAEYRREFGSPAYGFSPDGDFPIANIEKGYCDAQLIFKGNEYTDIECLSAGDSPNTVPSSAKIKLKGAEMEAYDGTAVHSSMPWLGDNAIPKLAKANPSFAFSRFILELLDNDFHGEKLGVDDGTDTYEGIFVSRTSCTPTILKLNDDKTVLLNINIRVRAGVGERDIRAGIEKHMQRYGYTYMLRDCTAPMLVDPGQEFLRDMNHMYEEYGYKGGFVVAEGASYAGTMDNCVCWGPVFPGDYSCAHKEDEQLRVESMFKAMALYSEFLIVTGTK